MTDTLRDMWTVAWHLRYILLFGALAFPVATAIALVYRKRWHNAAGLLKVYVDELRIADRYGKTLEARLAKAAESVIDNLADDDPIFEQGYVYDRIPAWVPADVPGSSPQEPRRVPR